MFEKIKEDAESIENEISGMKVKVVSDKCSALTFREEPNDEGRIIMIFNPGTEVSAIVESDPEWSKVEYDGKIGYSRSEYLSDATVNDVKNEE